VAAFALKDATDLVEQELKMDQAVDSLVLCVHEYLLFRVAEQRVMVRI
jgi:hypothetical protein